MLICLPFYLFTYVNLFTCVALFLYLGCFVSLPGFRCLPSFVAFPRGGEGTPRQLFRVQAVGTLLGVVL